MTLQLNDGRQEGDGMTRADKMRISLTTVCCSDGLCVCDEKLTVNENEDDVSWLL